MGSRKAVARVGAIKSDQAMLRAQLRSAHATHVQSFQLLNAMAATVSKAERATLAADPDVAKVIPDVTIHGAAPAVIPAATKTSKARAQSSRARRRRTSATLSPNVIPGACSARRAAARPRGPVLHQHGLRRSQPADGPLARASPAPASRSRGSPTGSIRTTSTSSGPTARRSFVATTRTSPATGPAQPTSGDEAFLDANTIAGQGLHTYNVQNFSAQPDPTACNIRIEGVAPGASLVGLECLRHLRGHDRVQLPAGDQLRGRDRPRQRHQRVVRLQPVPRRHRARRHRAVQRRGRRRRRDRHRLHRRRRARSTRSARRRPTPT